jgi:hypothetical protein
MTTEIRGLALVCAISMAVLALMLVPGLPLQPTIVNAQEPNQICSGGGVTGCITCPYSTGYGCNIPNGNLPANWKVGWCVQNSGQECSSGTLVCGAWINCTTKKKNGNNCATMGICI